MADYTLEYTGAQIDDLLGKAGDAAPKNTVYTKAEVDSKLSDKVDAVSGKGLSSNDFTNEEKTKLAELENYDDTDIRTAINSTTQSVSDLSSEIIEARGTYSSLDERLDDMGTGGEQVQSDWNETDSTAPSYIRNKPNIPSGVVVDLIYDPTSENAQAGVAVAEAIIDKVDKVNGKGLSTNDFTDAYKDKLDGVESGAEANVQSDWAQSDDTADDYIKNKPTINPANDAVLEIQKNGTKIGEFTANASANSTVNITVPVNAGDISALPDNTKYGAALSLSIDSSTYIVTATLVDQDGETLGTVQTIDLPLESVVVNGSYDDATKKVILMLKNGTTVDFSVADLVAGLQTEITTTNKLSSDLVDDTNNTHKFVTATEKADINRLAAHTAPIVVQPPDSYLRFYNTGSGVEHSYDDFPAIGFLVWDNDGYVTNIEYNRWYAMPELATDSTISISEEFVQPSSSGGWHYKYTLSVTADPVLSSTSTNPVQNKVLTKEIASLWLSQKSTRGGVYGAYWDGGESPVLTRTDDAATLSDPNPYYSGNTSYGSPFDTIMPWAGIERYKINGNEFVKIPKFWFKVTKSGDSMRYQIANSYQPGFHVSPAHADRGDGVGERDYVYVGRYHCASDYKSKSGVAPISNITRDAARTGCHSLGDNYWQFDFAMFWTTRLLYIVEMANFDSQAVIGYGRGNNSSTAAMGYTDTMPYHTGTMAANRTTYGANTQYRYMEGLWDNVLDWCDGIGFSDTDVYVHNTPSGYNDSRTNYTLVGTRSSTSNCIKSMFLPTAEGYEYAMYPATTVSDSSCTKYFADYCGYSASGVVLCCGGNWSQSRSSGMFYLRGYDSASSSDGYIGARLQYLPG